MKRNTLLNLALVTGRLLIIFNILTFLAMTCMFIHVQVSPQSYVGSKFSVFKTDESVFRYSRTEKWGDAISIDANSISVNQLTTASLYFNYFQIAAILIFTFMIIRAFLSVIRSVQFTETFRSSNARVFRKMGMWLLFIFFLSAFSFVSTDSMIQYTFYLRITPLILMLLAYIMAEVFKEGSELSEESQLTI